MQDSNLLSVIDQHAALLGSDQEMPGRNRQDRGDSAGIGLCGKNLAEAAPVESQHSVAGSRHDQFGLTRISQNRRSERHQWRSRKFAARCELTEQRTLWRVFLQPGWAGKIQMILKTRGSQENRGSADGLESGIEYGRQWPHSEAELMLGADILGGGPQGPRTAPDDRRSQRDSGHQSGHTCRAHENESWPPHHSSGRNSEL